MATKKVKKTVSKSTKAVAANATPKEIIAKYDCLQTHVKILTVLSGLIFLSVVMLGVILLNCGDCKNPAPVKTNSSAEVKTSEE